MFLEFLDVDSKEQIAIRKTNIREVIIGSMPEKKTFFISIGYGDEFHSLYESDNQEEATKKYKEILQEIREDIHITTLEGIEFELHQFNDSFTILYDGVDNIVKKLDSINKALNNIDYALCTAHDIAQFEL